MGGLGAIAIIALAFCLRVYRLGDKNIWWDEGWTVWLAQHDFSWIALRTASDEHPPLHYWLMHVWQTALGTDAFTGRFVSLAFGVMLVAVIYRLARDMGGVRLGLLAGLFFALTRFTVWWSQDIKNYTLSAFFAWASVWFTWQLAQDDTHPTETGRRISRRDWLLLAGYTLSASLALYSHYLAALIVIANNLFVGIILLYRLRAGNKPFALFLKWCLAQIAVLVLFLPWLAVYLQNGATWSAAPPFNFSLFLRLAATVLNLGVTTYIENYTWIVLAFLAIAALSLGWFFRRPLSPVPGEASHPSSPVVRPSSSAALYMLLIALFPPALIYILSLTPAAIFAPKIQARYLMMLTPAVSILLALGVLFVADTFRTRPGRLAAAAMVLFIVAAQLYTLDDYYGDRYLRDEYATLSQVLNNFGAEGDAIVLNTDQEWPTFLYYLKRPFDWQGVPNGIPVDAAAARRLASAALQHRAVWVVTIPDALQYDPTRLVEQAIAERLPKQYEQTFGDKRLALYADTLRNVKDAAGKNFSPLAARNDTFDERLKLVGVDLPVREAMAGDVVHVVTYWEAQDLATINLALETLGGEIVARTGVPISIGAHERAQGDLQVPPDLNAQELRVVAQARLNTLPIGTLRVLSRAGVNTGAVDAAMETRGERFGEHVRLKGTSAPQANLRAGDDLPITLFWQTDAPLPASYTVFVHLLGEQYNPARNNLLWGQVDRLPLDGKLPTTAWVPNQTIADAYRFKIDDHAPAGSYKIELGMYDASGTRLRVYNANGTDIGDALIVGQVNLTD